MGGLLRQLEHLINEARHRIKSFEEGRTEHIGYVREFRNHVQYCLLDIGQLARDELRQINTLDLSISEGLQRYYDDGIFNDFEVKDGDPSEFLRLQKEYDQAMPKKIQYMITLLNQVRNKMLGHPSPVHPVETAAKRRFGPKPAMERHRRIAEIVTNYGDKWKQEEQLGQIAPKLDQGKIKTSPAWTKWNPPTRSWRRAVENNREKVIKAIEYSLKMASKDN